MAVRILPPEMMTIFRIALLSILLCGFGLAQSDDSRPAPSNVRGAEYPRIHPDLRVTFRIKAPDAKKVQLQPGGDDNGLGKGPMEMERADDGTWSVTIPPVIPGFHYYWFLVDGLAVSNPASETYFGWAKESSGVDVPGPDAEFYAVKDVPARRRSKPLVFLEDDSEVAARLCVHSAGV